MDCRLKLEQVIVAILEVSLGWGTSTFPFLIEKHTLES
jgi:hypothetical protein